MKFILGMLWICSAALFAAGAFELTPSPKQITLGKELCEFSLVWDIEGGKDFTAAEDWLREEFKNRHWEVGAGAAQIVSLKNMPADGNPETYRLRIHRGGVELAAATPEGMMRAVGRFLSLLKNPSVQFAADSFRIPALEINDYPDFPVRVMDLTMAFWEPFSDAERLDSTRKIIAIMAEHGFNYVVIEVGGNYVSQYFKSHRPTPWSRQDLKELVRFCKQRGVVPIPGINTIGHIGRAPQICLLKKGQQNLGHDIRKEEFFTSYANVLDELMELFDYPKYFRVGGDEANNVFAEFKLTASENCELFVKVFNFAASHLAKYHCRPIIWHDMLFAGELGGKRISDDGITESGIAPAQDALDKLSRQVIVNYWHYGAEKRYPGIDYLREAGFETWASTWHFPAGIFALANYAGKKGVTAYDGTTWSNNHTKGGALVLVGECAWNSRTKKVAFDPDEVFMREWGNPPYFANAAQAVPLNFASAVPVTPLTAQKRIPVGNLQMPVNQPVSAAKTKFITLEYPDEIVQLRKSRPDTELFLRGAERFVMRPTVINDFRSAGSLALYTPSHGKTTGQNKWGDDWIVVNGSVIEKTVRKENNAIPAGGGVISAQVTGGDTHNNTRKLMAENRVELIAGQAEVPGTLPELKAVVNKHSTNVVLLFGSRLWLYSERAARLLKIKVKTAGGEEKIFQLDAGFALAPDPRRFNNFTIVYLPEGLAAVIYTGDGNEAPAEVSLEYSPLGVQVDTQLLSAMEL